LLNIRGAAALLRKIYEANARPSGTTEGTLESWRYAIRIYCGIPEPDLNARHALDIYTFINKGYHDFGIEWPAKPVNLEPIRRETAEVVAAEELKRRGGTNQTAGKSDPPSRSNSLTSLLAVANSSNLPGLNTRTNGNSGRSAIRVASPRMKTAIGIVFVLLGVLLLFALLRRKRD
jgi:hypothetical protein